MVEQSENTAQRAMESEFVRPPRTASEPLLEASFVGLGCVLQCIGWARYLAPQPPLQHVVLGVVLGWLLADAMSGITHFLADNFGSPRTPFLGRVLIAPFREHHHHPTRMLEHDFWERNGWNFAGGCLIGLPGLVASGQTGLLVPLSLSTAIFVSLTNQIHTWAHHRRPPRWVSVLQSCGLLLLPQSHARHHAPFDGNSEPMESRHHQRRTLGRFFTEHYCITSGFWDRLFSTVRKLNGRWAYPPAAIDTLPHRRD